MKKTEISIFTWAVYIILLGLCLILFPTQTVSIFGYEGVDEALWIRMLGILSIVLGMYYFQMVRHKVVKLYPMKLAGHSFGIFCMGSFLIYDLADSRIIGTMLIDTAALMWTAVCLRLEKKRLPWAT